MAAPYMISSQSAPASFISSLNVVTWDRGTCGSREPWQTRTRARAVPGSAGAGVARPPWMLTTPARSAPARAMVRTARPPKQNPTAARQPLVPGLAASAVRPAWPRRAVAQRGDAADDPFAVPGHPGTEHVAGQYRVPEPGVAGGLVPGVVVQAGSAVHQQDAGPGAGGGLVPEKHPG